MNGFRIPTSLWHDQIIRMPEHLAREWEQELRARGWLEQARGPQLPEKELFGGELEEDALKHFAHRFQASCARTVYVAMDPRGTFENVSVDLLGCLFDGTLAVLDIPCGSGGGLLGLLSTVAELRVKASLPRLPTIATILAGDLSPVALRVHESMIARYAATLSATGISIACEHCHWDVRDSDSTAALLDRFFHSCPTSENYLVLVSAFSGFADQHRDEVLQAFHQIEARFHDKSSSIRLHRTRRPLRCSWTDSRTRDFNGDITRFSY